MTKDQIEDTVVKDMIENGIPDSTSWSIMLWYLYGLEPGGFLKAVIKNDLSGAFAKADERNMIALKEIVNYFYNSLPMNCWGSEEALRNWEGVEIK